MTASGARRTSVGDPEWVAEYVSLVDFLGAALGPSYEVVLHDLTKLHGSVVAIANGELSGRSVGSPATDLLLRIVREGLHETRAHLTGYEAVTATDRRQLTGATHFIKRDGRLVGALCINHDASALTALAAAADRLLKAYVPTSEGEQGADAPFEEHFSDSVEAMVSDVLAQVCEAAGTSPSRLTSADRLAVVRQLYGRGFFQLKGAVTIIADELGVSEPSVYRYLSTVRKDEAATTPLRGA